MYSVWDQCDVRKRVAQKCETKVKGKKKTKKKSIKKYTKIIFKYYIEADRQTDRQMNFIDATASSSSLPMYIAAVMNVTEHWLKIYVIEYECVLIIFK